jgi:multidrug efflux pump subunit AcrB
MEAADEIGLAVIATTFTLIAVFLPTAFMSGIPGKFFKQFGWTASLAVFASLVVARVLTPMMAAYILKPIVTAAHEPGWLKRYLVWATWCMRHRLVTMVLGHACFSSAPSCWCLCCPRASSRRTTIRKPRSMWSCHRVRLWRKPRPVPNTPARCSCR